MFISKAESLLQFVLPLRPSFQNRNTLIMMLPSSCVESTWAATMTIKSSLLSLQTCCCFDPGGHVETIADPHLQQGFFYGACAGCCDL
ncbi:hypothetical protein BDA96_03G167100 [Sorghum bicolor]|uniref:Uncharacterized protein n=2 Tax=Sorghum bicolor TaxID=4558 RepID=A0A921REE1_SORBI|nr:hypothetical protein BDA96_03G167100 [Sorghum bicolor]OQU86828.1 hypothetical protein SORBI_3003G158201 [Sorghum bicolor]